MKILILNLFLVTTAFSQEGEFKKISEKVLWKKRSCQKMSILLAGKDPIQAGSVQTVEIHRYIPRKKTELKTHVMIIPPTTPPRGEATVIDKWYAENLCSKGVGSIILDNWDGYAEPERFDFDTNDRASLRAMNVGKMALNYLNQPVLILGTSVGAIYASMLMGSSPQILGGVLIVGGAPMVEIIKTSDQEFPRKQREERMKKMKISSLEEYEKLLNENVHFGPEDFLAPEKSKRMLMVLAREDTTVPTATQEKLWQMWGKPTRIDHASDHSETIIKSFLHERGRIKRFFLNQAQAEE